MLRDYSAVDRLTRVPSGKPWEKLQAFAARVAAGEVPSPCGDALHWFGHRLKQDAENARKMIASGEWEIARCEVSTANTFLRRVSR